ncbi:Uncharacterised protein [uncultured archaeon]|nr:Uncharacterised protein [uncultured archaeon]
MRKNLIAIIFFITIVCSLTIYFSFFQKENNLPPEKPNTPSGSKSINVRQNSTYTSSSHDPDNDSIRYGWDWDGDNNVDEWTKTYLPNETLVTAIHQWRINGTFNIKLKAQDVHGAESPWSNNLTVTVHFIPSHPNIPKLSGPTHLVVGEVGIFYASTTTLDDPPFCFYYMWDDRTYNKTDYVNSGETISASHAWNTPGNYTVVCEAENKYYYRSSEATLQVVISEK